jgi:hypothetical protein
MHNTKWTGQAGRRDKQAGQLDKWEAGQAEHTVDRTGRNLQCNRESHSKALKKAVRDYLTKKFLVNLNN